MNDKTLVNNKYVGWSRVELENTVDNQKDEIASLKKKILHSDDECDLLREERDLLNKVETNLVEQLTVNHKETDYYKDMVTKLRSKSYDSTKITGYYVTEDSIKNLKYEPVA